MDNAGYIEKGWTGTPGTQVWTEGQAPVDIGVEPPDLSGGLFDRRPTEISPVTRAAMGGMGVDVEPGATYPGPSPIAMGGDPSQFGAELMQTPQLGGGFVPGSFEQASYDPRMSTAYQEKVALNQLAAQQPPTYGVSGREVTATGIPDLGTAQDIAAATEPGPTWNISDGELTVEGGGTFEEMRDLLAQMPKVPRTVEDAAGLRGEFAAESIVADAQKIMMSYAKLREVALAEPTGPNDLSIIFSFMKMLDPGSVVRESEFANAQNAQGVPELIRSQFNRIQAGERLTPDSRAKFLRSAEELLEGQKKALVPVIARYKGLAQRSGDPWENVGYDPLEGAGVEGGSPIINMTDRVNELLREDPDMTDDEVYEVLRSEGYIG